MLPCMTGVHEVRIEGLSWGGRGVGHLGSGKVVMVAGAAPGDLVRAAVTEEKASYALADVDGILEPGERVEPACALAGRCGGCGWQHVPVAAQRRWKRDLLAAEIERRGIGPAGAVGEVIAGAASGFRVRTRLHRRGTVTGYAAAGSSEIVRFAACPVLAAPLQEFACSLAAALEGGPCGDADLELYVDVRGRRGLQVADTGRTGRAAWEGLAAGLGVHTLAISRGRRTIAIPGDASLVEDSAGLDLGFQPGVFVQTNREMNARLVRAVVEGAGEGASFAEVYAGAGNFTLHLAGRFSSGTAAEPDGPSARWLARNLAGAGRVRAVREDDASAAARLASGRRVDLLLADPPRAGMRPLHGVFASSPPRRFVLVSCHPMAAVRDMEHLARLRYGLESLTPIDVFPQTPHLEIVAVMSRECSGPVTPSGNFWLRAADEHACRRAWRAWFSRAGWRYGWRMGAAGRSRYAPRPPL